MIISLPINTPTVSEPQSADTPQRPVRPSVVWAVALLFSLSAPYALDDPTFHHFSSKTHFQIKPYIDPNT